MTKVRKDNENINEPSVEENPIETVEEYLDMQEIDRMEWERFTSDLYPEERSSGPRSPRIHRDSDPVQSYLAEERRKSSPWQW